MNFRLRIANLKFPILLVGIISLLLLIYFGHPLRQSYLTGGKGKPGVSVPANSGEKRSASDQVIDQARLLEEAKRRGIEQGLDLSSVPQKLRPRLIIQRLKQEVCEAEGRVTADELLHYYSEHREEFSRRPQIRIHHILVEVGPDATEDERESARQKAEELMESLRKSRKDSEDIFKSIFRLAKEFLEKDQNDKRWGDLGWFSRGHFPPEFDEVVFSLKLVGDYQLFETEMGYHIVQLMDKRKPRVYALEEVKGLIGDRLRAGKREQCFRHFGEALRSRESSEGMVFIPGGTCWLGATEKELEERLELYNKYVYPHTKIKTPWWYKELPQYYRKVKIAPFYIDPYEVTLGEYEEFIKATGHRLLPDWVSKYSPGDDYPVVGVDWHDVRAYCEWREKRLPTAEEWEFAARGTERRRFPWGNALPDGTRANYCDYSCKNPWRAPESNDGFQYTAPVGSYPKGVTPEGLYDLAGNVREWTSTIDIESNKVVVKSGSYFNAIEDCLSFDRRVNEKDLIDPCIGFRCAKDK